MTRPEPPVERSAGAVDLDHALEVLQPLDEERELVHVVHGDAEVAHGAVVVRLAHVRAPEVDLRGGARARDLREDAGAIVAHEAEDALVGRRLDSDSAGAVATVAEEVIEPLADIHGSAPYRRKLIGVAVERALTDAAKRG